ncbi:MAG TPA: M28 family metallopeptidase [Thermoanaerobaculia bacterium]|nr:M28 family metallopeptidase [Thermoanaerobaculia bacterium]
MKRILLGGGLILTCLLFLSVVGLAQPLTTDPEISAIVSSVDSSRILNTAQTMQNFRTRQSCSDQPEPGHGVTAARDYLFNQYSSIPGLQVRLDPFVHARCPNAPTFNVIAWLPSEDEPAPLVIIGGHYDSRTTNVNDAVSDAPGGNDAGAQTGVVLELARVLAGHHFNATIVFMSFSGEEQGLFGSSSIAANLGRYFPESTVIAMLNTDIPGGDNTANTPADLQFFRLYSPGIPRERLSTTPDGTTDNTSPSRGVMRYIGAWGGAYVPAITMAPKLREDRPGRASDHAAFINNAFPAVRFMETFECSPSPVDNSCGAPLPCPPPANIPTSCKDTTFVTTHQHSPNDLVQFLTLGYSAKIAQVMASVAASLARAPGSPRNFTATGNSVQGVTVNFIPPDVGQVDHFIVAARSVSENFYRQRVNVSKGKQVSAQTLGLNPGDSFFVSVAAVDKQGHESLFAYPEVRCDSSSCAIPTYAFDVTAPLPPPPPATDDADEEN